jgi:hypothetical protein
VRVLRVLQKLYAYFFIAGLTYVATGLSDNLKEEQRKNRLLRLDLDEANGRASSWEIDAKYHIGVNADLKRKLNILNVENRRMTDDMYKSGIYPKDVSS